MRSVSRLADVSINTVSKLLEDAGRFCAGFHDAKVRNVKAKRVQVDEIWSFTAAKQKNVASDEKPDRRRWRHLDLDRDRSRYEADHFAFRRRPRWRLRRLVHSGRSRSRRQSHPTHVRRPQGLLEAVEGAFGADIDYAMLVKIYGASPESAKGRYSPAECIGAIKTPIEGKPDPKHMSDVLQRARESHDADAQPPLHAADKCVLKEIREPRAHGRDLGASGTISSASTRRFA